MICGSFNLELNTEFPKSIDSLEASKLNFFPGNSMDMDQIPVLDFSDETGIVFSTTPTRSARINKCSLSTAKLNR